MNAQDSLLSVLLAHNEAYWRVSEIVCQEDFTPRGRRIYLAIADAVKAGEAIDAITMEDEEALDIQCNAVGSLANVESYARVMAEAGERKRVREAGQRIVAAESYAQAQSLLAEVRPNQASRLKTATDGLREMMEALQKRFDCDGSLTGASTGLESLDLITGGWQEGDLIGVGGATSSGKTAFALQSAIAAGRTYYASLEMMASQLLERSVCNIGHIPYRHIRFPKEAPEEMLTQLYAAVAKAKGLPLIVDDQPGVSVDQISSRARQLHMQEPLRLIVVDHLNLVRRPRKHDATELGEIAIQLKNLAKDLRVPVMVLVQLNRDSGKGDDKRPQLGAFRNSGEIEEALDTAVMVYRDEYYNPNGPLAGYAELIVRKQRQGERNVTAWAKSYLSQMRFESCNEPDRSATETQGNDGRGGFASRFGQRIQSRPLPGTRSDYRQAAGGEIDMGQG